MNVCFITGSRAEYGLLAPLMKKFKNSNKHSLNIMVTGMHLSKKYGSTIKEITKAGFNIHGTIPMVPKQDTNYDMS